VKTILARYPQASDGYRTDNPVFRNLEESAEFHAHAVRW
jgi:hypothetical protein